MDTVFIVNNDLSFWGEVFPNYMQGVGTVIAVLGLLYTFKSFRKQKWWERKAEAYTNILESLYGLKKWSSVVLDSIYDNTKVDNEKVKQLQLENEKANSEIQKYIDIGIFIISEDAIERLKLYLKDNNPDYGMDGLTMLQHDIETTDGCIDDIMKIAKKELKTNNYF